MTTPSRPTLASVVGAGSVVLSPYAALWLLRTIGMAEEMYGRAGMALPADLAEIRATLQAAAQTAHSFAAFANESAKAALASDLAPSAVGTSNPFPGDPVDVREAAALVGLSEQAVRARCRRGVYVSARQLGGRAWQLSRAEVLARIHDEAA